ncbi:MAG: hypothetical protein QNJ62_06650 [Methyloceanibacter sp.]|nr:hypothetical protein [Methyloceanibacter sp.]
MTRLGPFNKNCVAVNMRLATPVRKRQRFWPTFLCAALAVGVFYAVLLVTP